MLYCSLASLDEQSGLQFEYEEHVSGNSIGEQLKLASVPYDWLRVSGKHTALHTHSALGCIQAVQDGAGWMPCGRLAVFLGW